MKKIALIFILLACISAFGQENPERSQAGAIFKMPKKSLPAPGKDMGFNGMFMLNPAGPSVNFICYPDKSKSETLDQLILRIKKTATGMVGEKALENKPDSEWTITAIPKHKGDWADVNKMHMIKGEKSTVQILFYKRGPDDAPFVYGYFYGKGNNAPEKEWKELWADEKGQGVDFFDEFWKTLN